MAPNSGACSRMRTHRPARPRASAVVSPPRPPPTMTIASLPPIHTSSCPRLWRASTPFVWPLGNSDVDGRNDHGHDVVERSPPYTPASSLSSHADPLSFPFEING